MTAFNQLQLSPGDRVIIPKSQFRLVQHHAIYDGNGHFYENKFGVGVVRTPVSTFFRGVIEISKIQRFHGTYSQMNEALTRAQRLLGRQYDLASFNCEHYADFVQFGRARSRQVETAAGIGIVAVLTWAVSRIA